MVLPFPLPQAEKNTKKTTKHKKNTKKHKKKSLPRISPCNNTAACVCGIYQSLCVASEETTHCSVSASACMCVMMLYFSPLRRDDGGGKMMRDGLTGGLHEVVVWWWLGSSGCHCWRSRVRSTYLINVRFAGRFSHRQRAPTKLTQRRPPSVLHILTSWQRQHAARHDSQH